MFIGAAWCAWLLCNAANASEAKGSRALPDLSRAEALATIYVDKGLRVDLVAGEPLVASPVAFAFDEKGRMYVAENIGYPDPVDSRAPATLGKIVLLEDTDGDGVYDKRTDFATGIGYPNGICPWQGGVFVTCAPDIYYFKDTNGDGVADIRRVVLTGFSTSRTAQVRVSHPTLGLDGRIYLTSGLNSGKITSPEHPERPPVEFTASDSRFDPDSLIFETTGGRGQFGLTIDDFGRRFISENRHPIMEVMLEPWHLRRNQSLAFSETIQEVSTSGYEAKVFPISHTSVTAAYIPSLMGMPHAGTFTSACGLVAFGGSGLGQGYDGSIFVCEPAQNLVQRQVLRDEGASFRSAPATAGREFLASADQRFRPVFCANGPDGALYVADMHRKEIDHPEYFPPEMRTKLDFEADKEKGRIYRIGAAAPQAAQPMPQTTAQLWERLDSSEKWQRDTAHRLLLERRDLSATAILERISRDGRLPAARVHALWLLWSFKALSDETLGQALHDPESGVRENALKLASELPSISPGLLDSALGLAGDTDARVRLQCALTLGVIKDPRAVKALARIAARGGEDRWTRAAVLSGVGDRLSAFLTAFRIEPRTNPVGFEAMMNDVGRLVGTAAPLTDCRRILLETLDTTTADDFPWRLSMVGGMAAGWQARPKGQRGSGPFFALLVDENHPDASQHESLQAFLKRTVDLAEDVHAQMAQRVEATAFLAYGGFQQFGSVLAELVSNREPAEVQLAAIRAIEHMGDVRGADMLVNAATWRGYTPKVRDAALAAMISRPTFVDRLFAAMESHAIATGEIPPSRRSQLLRHADPVLRARAEKVFHELVDGNRMQVYQTRREALALTPDAGRGKLVFERTCAACHTYNGTGGHVGPDLSGVHNQPAEALLLNILVPNYEIAAGYQPYELETTDGRSFSGWLAAESDVSVTLRTLTGADETVLRSRIHTLKTSGVSLMPDGLESGMSNQELADLIGYLKEQKNE
jgi:putative membrane-bound dehydrogenase-like protein